MVGGVDQAEWDARYAASDLVWSAGPNRFVEAALTGVPPGRALDLASGEGRHAIWLASLGWQVTAVDFSKVAIERGRRLATARGVQVDWVRADVLDYRPEAGAFDAVLIAYLHLLPPALAAVLARAARAVAPGGRILVIGHDVSNLRDGVGGPQDPDLLHTPEMIAAGLAGLDVRRAERVRRPVETPDGVVDAIDTLVYAVRPGPPAAAVGETREAVSEPQARSSVGS
jgi:SAM-dependent methyltransferase